MTGSAAVLSDQAIGHSFRIASCHCRFSLQKQSVVPSNEARTVEEPYIVTLTQNLAMKRALMTKTMRKKHKEEGPGLLKYSCVNRNAEEANVYKVQFYACSNQQIN